MKKVLDTVYGVTESLVYDGDDVHVQFEGNNTAQMDANAAARNDGTNGYNESRDLRKLIELDWASVRQIETMHGVKFGTREFDDVVLKLARSSDWRDIRTTDGGIPDSMIKPKWI